MATSIFKGEPPAQVKQWMHAKYNESKFVFYDNSQYVTIGASLSGEIHGPGDDITDTTGIWIFDENTYSVKFTYSDQNLYNYNLKSAELKNITSIGDYAFAGCIALTSVTIPITVTSIGYQAFSGCTSLTSIIIPANVISIGTQAFNACYNLANITFNSYTKSQAQQYIIGNGELGNGIFGQPDSMPSTMTATCSNGQFTVEFDQDSYEYVFTDI